MHHTSSKIKAQQQHKAKNSTPVQRCLKHTQHTSNSDTQHTSNPHSTQHNSNIHNSKHHG
jgi:hypothetical protein